MPWDRLSSETVLASGQRVRQHISYHCVPFGGNMDFGALRSAIGGVAVVNIERDVVDTMLDPLSINVSVDSDILMDGTKAGQVTTAVLAGWNIANDAKAIPCWGVSAGNIEIERPGSVTDPPNIKTTISLAALAVIAIVGLVLFSSVRGALPK